MSAAPAPKPDPEPSPQGPDADGWALLDALRRKLDDQSSQGRKTQQQVTQLAESIASLVEHQRRRARGLNLNSFIAYLIFTMLCGTGFYLLYRTRVNELVEARSSAQRDRDVAAHRADEATAKLTAREAAATRAWEIYQLLETGKRTEATAKLGALGDLPLSHTERAVLAARAHETQVMEVDAALKAAAASFKAGHHADVIAPLEAALVGEPAGARASAMHYYLGVAYAKGTDLAKATAHLQAAVTADVDQEDARFQLASVLDRSGQYAKARAEYDRFATAHPQSGLAVFAMRRSATLARMPAVAPMPPVAKPATPAVGTPAATTVPVTPAPAPSTPSVVPSPAALKPIAPKPIAPKPVAPKPVAPSATPATPGPTTTQVTPSAAQPMTSPPTSQVAPMSAPSPIAIAMSSPSEPPTAEAPPKHEPAPRLEPVKPAPLPPSHAEPAPGPWPPQPPHEPEPRPEPPVAQRPPPPPTTIDAHPSGAL